MEKAKFSIFIHFTGFSIWDWDMDLRSRHHVSIIRTSDEEFAKLPIGTIES